MMPCESVAEARKFNTFGSMRAGCGEIDGVWETTGAAKIRNRPTNRMNTNLNCSVTSDEVRSPVTPMAAHHPVESRTLNPAVTGTPSVTSRKAGSFARTRAYYAG
jgi:hypothetical protein